MSCDYINYKYNKLCNTPSDINEHLPTLKKYAENCDIVIEFGVRWIVSTWAFLAARPKQLISYDFQDPNTWGANINEALSASVECNLNFSFILDDTRKIEIKNCDLLFIDTLHEYDQVSAELKLHSSKVNKYIIFHDTVSFRETGENGGRGIYYAIQEFLDKNKEWHIVEEFKNNNGLLVIGKK